MRAVDALAIAAMLGRAVVIDSTEPLTGEPIRVHTHTAAVSAEPSGTVVYLAATAAPCQPRRPAGRRSTLQLPP